MRGREKLRDQRGLEGHGVEWKREEGRAGVVWWAGAGKQKKCLKG